MEILLLFILVALILLVRNLYEGFERIADVLEEINKNIQKMNDGK